MRSPSARVFVAFTAVVATTITGCGKVGTSASGSPIGKPRTVTVDASGGSVTSDDGLLTVTIPAGALPAPTDVTVTTITNVAPGGIGNAYRLQPDGLVFASPVSVAIQAPAAPDVATAYVAYQAPPLWIRPPGQVRDTITKTISVATSHFSDWTVVVGSANDLYGQFTYASTLDGVLYSAAGQASLNFAGGGTAENDYWPTGTITLQSTPIPYGSTTCTALSPVYEMHPSLAQAFPAPPNANPGFLWGINAEWQLTCADGSGGFIATQFDTAGINLIGCQRGYVGTPIVTPIQVAGDYRIDCGARGYVETVWNFTACASGATCVASNPCQVAEITCQASGPVCTDLGPAPNGTPCPTGTCNAGVCGPSATVTGNRLVTYWPDAGALPAAPAADVASAPQVVVEALAPDGAGGWTTPPYPGTFQAADGSFAIPAVPSAPFLLAFVDRAGVTHLVDGAPTTGIDLGFDLLGRADLAEPTASTPVTFSVDGLAGWSATTDRFEILSSNADVWDYLNASGLVAPAGTLTDDWFASTSDGNPLHLLAASDLLYGFQLTGRTDPASGLAYLGAEAWTSTSGVTLSNATPATVPFPTVTVSPTQTGSVTGTWSVSSFESYLPSMSPIATTNAWAHTLSAGATACTSLSTWAPAARAVPTLLTLQLAAGSAPDPALGTLAYAQFLDALWKEWRAVEFTGHVAFLAAGATTEIDETVSIGQREPMSPPPTTPLAPALGPPQYVSITSAPLGQVPSLTTANAFGTPAGTTISAVTTTPVFSWGPPALGTPTSYVLEVYVLANTSGATTRAQILRWETTSTQVKLPPGLLQVGATYFARLTSRTSVPAYSPVSPFRVAPTFAYASMLSAPFTP